MTIIGKDLRMGKIFRSDGKTLIVAMDHGLGGPRKGIESPKKTIQKIVEGEPDSIIVNLGVLREFSKELKELRSVMWNVPSMSLIGLRRL